MAKKNDNSTRAQVLAILAGQTFKSWREASVALQNTKDRSGKSIPNCGNHHNRSVAMTYLLEQQRSGNQADYADWKESTARAMDIEIGTLEAAIRGIKVAFELCGMTFNLASAGLQNVSRGRTTSEVGITDEEIEMGAEEMNLFGAPQPIHSVISTPRAPAGSGQPQPQAPETVTNGKPQKSRR